MWDEIGEEQIWEDIWLERHGCQVIWSLFSEHGTSKGKGKGHPITGHKCPEGEQMYSSTLPSALALDWGGWSSPRPGRFTPAKDPVRIVQEAGWAPGLVWMGVENLAPTRIRSPDCPGRSESLY